MKYLYRTLLLVSVSDRSVAKSLAASITGGDPNEEAKTYACPLSATGELPVTHYACCTAVSTQMLDKMTAILQGGQLPSVQFWRWDASTGQLLSSNVSGTKIGEIWDPVKAFESSGLRPIETLSE